MPLTRSGRVAGLTAGEPGANLGGPPATPEGARVIQVGWRPKLTQAVYSRLQPLP